MNLYIGSTNLFLIRRSKDITWYDAGILIDASGTGFVKAVAQHIFRKREAILKELAETKA